jgi:hypothetical protein
MLLVVSLLNCQRQNGGRKVVDMNHGDAPHRQVVTRAYPTSTCPDRKFASTLKRQQATSQSQSDMAPYAGRTMRAPATARYRTRYQTCQASNKWYLAAPVAQTRPLRARQPVPCSICTICSILPAVRYCPSPAALSSQPVQCSVPHRLPVRATRVLCANGTYGYVIN